jgi:hypothetical protein
MTKIANQLAYKVKSPLSLEDYAIGTNAESNFSGLALKQSISMKMSEMRDLFLAGLNPELGGTLKISEIEYEGVLTSPAAVANALDPAYEVVQYEVLILNVNGNKYLLKEQDLTIGVAQPDVADSDFINIIAFTQLGDGTPVLKSYNSTSGNWEFYAIKSTGNDVSIVSNNVVINPKAGTNLGTGQILYKGLNATTKLHEFYNLKSNTNIITLVGNDVFIDDASTATIPALYVNNLYLPTYDDWVAAGGNLISNPSFDYKGEGTLAKPFTDTVRYTSAIAKTTTANTSVQNALDAYVGSGTRLAPELIGQKIIVQDNNGFYTFAGDFSYENIILELQGNILSTTTGKIVDMDNASNFNATNGTCTINVTAGYSLEIEGDGFFNSGSTVVTTTYATRRTLYLKGEGQIFSENASITKYILNADPIGAVNGTTGCNNDGNLCIEVDCIIGSVFGGVYKVGGLSRVEIRNEIYSSTLAETVNTSLVAMNQTGGDVRLLNCTVSAFGGTRDNAFVFTPTNGFTPSVLIRNTLFRGTCTTWFNKANNNATSFNAVNCFTLFFGGTQLFNSTNLWEVNFRNNIFEQVGIDFTKVDFTQGNTVSSINTIGGNVIETLVSYATKAAAKADGLPTSAIFLKRVTVNAVDLVAGVEYKIATAGSPSLGTVGNFLTATGSETGTGTAYLETIEIL